MKKLVRLFCGGLRNGLIAIGALAFAGAVLALANYTATQGSGTTFGSIVVSTVHYIQTLTCDPTTPSQCVNVSSGGAGSANLAQVAGSTVQTGNGTNSGTQRVSIASDNTAFAVNSQPTPVTSGGLSVYFVQPAASDNHANIKNGAGQVYKISVTNNSATVNYIRLYNAGTGFNGCNSATNLVYANAIPASTTVGGLLDQWDAGMSFSAGISICVTSGYATNDTTNATATAMDINIGYK